eukprot:3396087-Amphidinium_carterae.1
MAPVTCCARHEACSQKIHSKSTNLAVARLWVWTTSVSHETTPLHQFPTHDAGFCARDPLNSVEAMEGETRALEQSCHPLSHHRHRENDSGDLVYVASSNVNTDRRFVVSGKQLPTNISARFM